MTTETRELEPDEFYQAEKVWEQYHDQKADPVNERIFGVFAEGDLAATARYTKHPDGVEMDCVFTSDQYRDKGYARDAVEELISHCGSETIYIHSTLDLVPFYTTSGFFPIPEDQLPLSIKERLAFCLGNMLGCNASPMERKGG